MVLTDSLFIGEGEGFNYKKLVVIKGIVKEIGR